MRRRLSLGWLAVVGVVLLVGLAPGVASASTAGRLSAHGGVPLAQAPAGLQAAVRRDLGRSVTSSSAGGGSLQRAELTAPGGAEGDEFGLSVAVWQNTAVVGDPYVNSNEGPAYVFVRSGDSWSETDELTVPDGAHGDEFGGSVAIHGSTIVIGAPYHNSGTGAAYVFAGAGDSWSEQAELTASDGAPGDEFGYSVGVWGSRVVVGAPFRANDTGAVYTFTETGGGWSAEREFTAPDGGQDEFGYSVGVWGSRVVAGAPGYDSDTGEAYVFGYAGGRWAFSSQLTASDRAPGDEFGYSVAIGGSTVVVGAPFRNQYTGAAYVFSSSGGVWSQQAELTASDGAQNDYFGYSVGLSGTTALVGAPGHNSATGAAYVFAGSGGSWDQTAELTASDGAQNDLFGYSVGVAGTTALVGAPGHNSDTGAAYVFAVPSQGVGTS